MPAQGGAQGRAKRGRKGGIPLDGALLRQKREARRLTPAELAKLAGVSANMIRLLERNERNASLILVRNLERALEVHADELGAAMPPPTDNGSAGSSAGRAPADDV
jgi:transcriptional regulator with XRE-family HTH domain